jgi:hypothetical protein
LSRRLADWLTGGLTGWLTVGQGFPFLAVVMLAVCFYVGGGLVYARQVQKSTTVGWMAHPHAHHWKAGISLVVDGMSFVGSKDGARARSSSRRRSRSDDSGGGNKSSYEKIDDEASAGGHKEKRSKHSKQQGDSDRSEKKKKKDTASKSSSSASRKANSSSSRKPPGSRSQNDDSTAQAALASSEKETETQRMLQEQVQMHGNLHQSQAKIKVVGLNESAEV